MAVHASEGFGGRFMVLDDLPLSNGGESDGEKSKSSSDDTLFLLPDCVLSMDSTSFREDLAAVAPGFLPPQLLNISPHNSIDSSDSNKSLKLADDVDGFTLARASDKGKTLWLCK